MPLLQYPYSHSTYFTRLEGRECSSELPPMNSAEDVAQIRFMHDRMLAAQCNGWDDQTAVGQAHAVRLVKAKWTRISRMSKDLKKSFRSSMQSSIQVIARRSGSGSLRSPSTPAFFLPAPQRIQQKEGKRLSMISMRSGGNSKSDSRSILWV
ncbi:hypothetical protein BKA70DRAFT_1301808 [Coprinopsis sp. MPI-PUGE-AT-0042]|nr:hypothetical protein BKA70DRAFT_1301808 [Coprinopsis sp. MPI-PUGE-AT-0042]